MESFVFLNVLSKFVGILNESRKLFLKNKKPMLLIVLFSLLLHSIIHGFNAFTLKSLVRDLSIKSSSLLVTSPNSPEFASLFFGMQREIKFIVGFEYIFIIISSITYLFFAIAVIHASSLAFKARAVSIQDFLLLSVKSFKRTFVTWSYITLFHLGYYFLLFMIFFPIVLFAQSSFALRTVTVILLVFESYVAIVWNVSLVVSVLEKEIYGIEAFGKAARIVKGMKPHLFILNLLCTILYWVHAHQLIRLINTKQQSVFQMIIGMLVADSILMVRMFVQMAYTVFYFHCKKIHGEEVELQGNMEYTKIPSAPLIAEDVP